MTSDFLDRLYAFFTENDLVCHFYHCLVNRLGSSANVECGDGTATSIVHTEYPTPFRCDMSHSQFAIKGDGDTTPGGGRYQRGHYDLVLINPGAISRLSVQTLRGQNYEKFKEEVLQSSDDSLFPILLHAFEFMLIRHDIRVGGQPQRSVERHCGLICQDFQKLLQSHRTSDFRNNPYRREFLHFKWMLVFDSSETGTQVRRELLDLIEGRFDTRDVMCRHGRLLYITREASEEVLP